MSRMVLAAACNSDAIVEHVCRATELLRYTTNPLGEHGVLEAPDDQLAKLMAARELIDKAVALHGQTRWPSARTIANANFMS